jgi:membrane associated rhomboid family serine protease
MPQCVECRKETPREQMYGVADDLRCPACANKSRVSLSSLPKVRPAYNVSVWSGTLVIMAIMISLAERIPGAQRVSFLWNEPDRIWDGELWRLLTTILPHVNLLHLLFNCIGMMMMGPILERAVGPNRFFAFVVLLAFASSASEFLVNPSPAIGLSGVLYGLFGYLFALRLYKDYARVAVTDGTMKMMFGWYVLCWILTLAGDWPVANYAHTGGFLCGWLVGKAIIKRHTELKIGLIVALVAVMVGFTTYMPWSSRYRFYQDHKAIIKAFKNLGEPLHVAPLIED